MYGINIFTLTFPIYKKKNESTKYHYSLYDFNILNSTAFIDGGISGNMRGYEGIWGDMRIWFNSPTPNCSYWGLFSAISCGIQHASVSLLNWLLGLSGINLLIRPIADIAKTTINFTKTACLSGVWSYSGVSDVIWICSALSNLINDIKKVFLNI